MLRETSKAQLTTWNQWYNELNGGTPSERKRKREWERMGMGDTWGGDRGHRYAIGYRARCSCLFSRNEEWKASSIWQLSPELWDRLVLIVDLAGDSRTLHSISEYHHGQAGTVTLPCRSFPFRSFLPRTASRTRAMRTDNEYHIFEKTTLEIAAIINHKIS